MHMNASAPEDQTNTAQAIHRYWVLVVEDDAEECDYLKSLLERNNVGVVATANLRDAAQRMQRQKFDCILLDLNLGHESGEKVLDLIEDRGSFNYRVPVIVMSGNLDADVIGRIKNSVRHILVKPFNGNQLMSKLYPIFHPGKPGEAA